MAKKNEIFNELKGLSVSVAALGNKNPFQIPAGYFDDLPSQVLNRVKNQNDEDISVSWKSQASVNPFIVPTAYFEGLAASIINRIKAEEATSHQEELEIISPLLGKLGKEVPYDLPSGYFDEFPGDVMSGVNAIDYVNHELESASSHLNDLRNKNVFTVPEGYFNQLAQEMLNRVKQTQKGPLIRLFPSKNIFRYSVAALLAGIISVSAWLFIQDSKPVSPSTDLTGIEKISDDEIVSYLENSSVSPAEGNGESGSFASFELKVEDVKEMLADVPDEELQLYLEQHAVTKDLKTN
ncbi:MAG: hypothetical protein WKF89_18165 [Chitinophagaceae bacterium]